MWRVEPEGEAERPEATVPWNGEGVSVNPEGESRHGQVRAKIARKEKENQATLGRKTDRNAPSEEGAEVQSSKRKVIRVESEETENHVRKSLNLSQDEAAEIRFVWCDNRCSFWQFASVVIDDVQESYTANLCQQCYNDDLMAKGAALLKNWQWKAVVEKKARRGRLWRMLEKDQYIHGMWEYFSFERAKAKTFMKDAEKEKQEGIQGQWQHESRATEYLEQVKCCTDTGCNPRMMKHFFVLKSGEWEKYNSIFKGPRNGPSKECVRPLKKWQKMKRVD